MTSAPEQVIAGDDTPDLVHDRPKHEEAQSALSHLFSTGSIARVINVDDSNQVTGDQEIDLELIIGTLTSRQLTLEMLHSSAVTRTLVVDPDGRFRDLDEVLDDLRVDPPRADVEVLQELTATARLSSQAPQSTPSNSVEEITTDLETRTSLASLLPDGVPFEAISLTRWRADKDVILADERPTLILFDRDFSLESERANTGDDLIIEVIRKDLRHVYCAMLTHSATSHERELSMMREIADSTGIDLAQLIVIAKDQVQSRPMDLVAKIKAAMLSRSLIEIRDTTNQAVTNAAKEGTQALAKLDSYTMLSMTQAAHNEGVHETENLLRVSDSVSRRHITRHLRTNGMEAVSRLRLLNASTPAGHGLHKPEMIDLYDHVENFDDESYLAELNLPLEPGDIFCLVDPRRLTRGEVCDRETRFVLIAQHCDTVVRPDGGRMGNPTMLVVAPLRVVDSSKRRSSDIELPQFDPQRPYHRWFARLGERTQLPTICLDACALSPNGTARIVVGEAPPPHLTPGWQRKYDKLQSWAKKCLDRVVDLKKKDVSAEILPLVVNALTGCGGDLHKIKAEVDTAASLVAFGIRRVSRLTDPNTRALLTLASHHIGRPALDGPLMAEIDADP